MAMFTFKPLHQNQLSHLTLCKYPSSSNSFNFHYFSHFLTFSPTKHPLHPKFPPFLQLTQQHLNHKNSDQIGAGFSPNSLPNDKRVDKKSVKKSINSAVEDNIKYRITKVNHRNSDNGFSSSRTHDKRAHRKTVEKSVNFSVEENTEKRPIKINHRNNDKIGSGFSSSRSNDKRAERKTVKNSVNSVVEENIEKRVIKVKDSSERRELGSWHSFVRTKNGKLVKNGSKSEGSQVITDNNVKKDFIKGKSDELGEVKKGRRAKKNKLDLPEVKMRIGLDMCSKRGDVIGAIKLYDFAMRDGISMGQYNYAVILYLCSSAATGVVQPAKSGSSNRSSSTMDQSNEGSEDLGEFGKMGKKNFVRNELNSQDLNNGLPTEKKESKILTFDGKQNSNEFSNGSIDSLPQTLDELLHLLQIGHYKKYVNGDRQDNGIQVGEDVKKYSLRRGLEIYEKMQSENVPMNEATLTSVARMAMSMGNGDMAFDMVKQMKPLGINPRLRSYGPALTVFCNNGEIDKAFAVEEHMLDHGVYPEEPELEALLRVSIEACKSDKVYYLLHKLRTRVRKVSDSTGDLIENWFNTKVASRIGKRKWDQKLVKNAIENGGGGWHGLGWLGKGKWTVSRTFVDANGLCKFCGEKLVTIDLDPIETENFAESVASIARKRERHSSFQEFQKWLDYYGPFEAVVDAANVGLFSQRKFKPSMVNAVVNEIHQKLPSKKWPLIVLHNRHIYGVKMNEPTKAVIEKWKIADALYATPTGSNDDWYWLYAAIKFKCLLVTNDEMRDHLFQLLGDDFFPKWKERHQVRFNFSEAGPVFRMPPPCSVVIQESEKGHWHVPIESNQDSDEERTWLCVTRANSRVPPHDFATTNEDTRSEKTGQSTTFEAWQS
ncbi:hypothetical protein LguiB_011718 [Lonicera macranthoides]